MSEHSEDIRVKLLTLPEKPGVYQFYGKNRVVIYVGKAKNLKKRVNSYFNRNIDHGKTKVMVNQICDIKYIVVDTELDALLLENNLIKEYQPKYNIQLKDDKTYPWICIKKEPFPRVFKTRRLVKDGSKYFGPYPGVRVIDALLDLIRELYPLRTCSLDLSAPKITAGKHKVCLEYHLGNCLGPCEGKQSEEEYAIYVSAIENIVKGNLLEVIRNMKSMMKVYADELKFEEAQILKSRIATIERYRSKSAIVSSKINDVDVITLLHDPKVVYVNYLVIHNGSITNGMTIEVTKKLEEKDDDVLGFVLAEMRQRFNSNSKEVVVAQTPSFQIENVSFHVPQRGDKRTLLELSQRNVTFYRLEKRKQEKLKNPERHTERILETIKKDFRLKELPIHIECFDNSNFHGTNAVAACVVFKNAKPSKKDYRHFNIKTVQGSDDFASMEEVVFRRYRRLIDEEQALPQLIVIDGGKGQLSSALKALEKLEIRGKVAIVGIAKKLEEIFFPGDQLPLYIDKKSESLRVIQYLRNEAHRFGITHHRNKRSKSSILSELTGIKGIGQKTYEELIRHFKSVSRVKDASLEELTEIIGNSKALLVVKHFDRK